MNNQRNFSITATMNVAEDGAVTGEFECNPGGIIISIPIASEVLSSSIFKEIGGDTNEQAQIRVWLTLSRVLRYWAEIVEAESGADSVIPENIMPTREDCQAMVFADRAFTQAVAEVLLSVSEIDTPKNAVAQLYHAVVRQDHLQDLSPDAYRFLRNLHHSVDTVVSDNT